MLYATEMAYGGMICIPIFMKIVTRVQVILRLCVRNLRSCNFGTIEGSEL
jgi:hypothetical protein